MNVLSKFLGFEICRHFGGFVGSPGTLEEREYKMWVLGETTSFMALLWGAPRFMQDRKSKDYNFTIYYIDLERIL